MGCVNAKPKVKRAGAAKVVKDAHDEGGPVGPFVPDGDLAAMYTENIAQLRRQVMEQGLTVVTEDDDDDDDDARSDASTEILPVNNNNNSASYADQQPGSATDRTRSKSRADRGNNNNNSTMNGLAPKQSVTPLRSMSGLSSSSPVGALLGMTTTTQAESGCSATVCICRPLFEEPSMGTGMFGEAYLADMTVTTGLVLPSAPKLNEERVLAALLTAAASHTAPEAVAEVDTTGERGNTPAGAAAAGSSLESKSVNSWTMSADGATNTNNIGSGSDTVGDGKPRRRKNKLTKQQQEQETRKGNKPNSSNKSAVRKNPNALGNDDNDGGSEAITRQSTTNNNNTDSLLTRTPQCSSLVQASAEWRQWRYLIAMTEFTVPGMDFDVLSTTKATLLSSMEQQQLSWLGAVREVVRQWCQLSVNCPHVLRCVQMEIFAKNEEVPTNHTTNKSTGGAAVQGTSTRGSGPPRDTNAAQTTSTAGEEVQVACAGDAKDALQPVVSVMDRHSSQLLRGSVRVTMRSELHFTESEVRTAMGMTEDTNAAHQQHSKSKDNTRPTTTTTANSSGQHHSTLPAHDYAACRTTKLRVYFELAKYGTLHTFRKEMQARYRRSYLHELTARALMREVLLGLYQVHEQGMLQYDLHAAEIYLVRPMQTVYKTLFPAYIADLPAGSIMKVPPNRMRHVLCQLDPTAPAAPRSASRDLRRRPLLAAPMPNTETTAAAAIGSNMNANTGNGGGGTSTALAAVTSGPHGSDVRRSRSVIAVASPETILGERSLEDIADLQDHLMQHHNHRPFGSPVRSNAAWPSPDGTHGTYDMISGTAEMNGANASSTSGCDMGNGSASPAGTAMRLDVFVGTEEDDDAFRLNPRAWRYFTEHGYLEDSLQLPSPINMYGLHEVGANSEDEERRSTNWFASSPERNKNSNSRRRSMPLMLTAASTSAAATTSPSALVGSAVTEVSLSAALQADKPAHNDNSSETQVGRYGGVAQVILQRSQPANVITNTSNGVVDRTRMAAGGSSNVYAESSMSTYGNTMTTSAGYGDGGNQASLQVSTSAFPLLLPPSRSATGLPTASGATTAVTMTRATCHRHTINPLPLLLAPRAKLDDFIVVPSVAEQTGGGLSERRALSASPLPSANRFASKDTRPSLRTRRPVVKLSGMIHVHRLLAQLSAHGPTHHGRNTSATNNNNSTSTAAAGNKGNNNSSSSGQAQSPFMVSVMRAEEVPVHRFIRVSHAAPEVLQRRRFSEASDVYAFAMTFLELVSPDGEVLPECRPTNMPFGRPTTRREWQEYDAQHALNLQRWYSTAIEQAIAQRSARAGLTGRSTGSGPDNNHINNEGRTTGRHGSDAMSRTQDDLVVVPIPSHLSDECKRMLRACLQVNPSHRPTVAELLGCKYFLLGHWIDAQGGGGGEEDCMSMGAILPEAPWGGEVDFVAAARAMGLPAMDHTNRAHSVTMPTAVLLHHS